MKSSKQRSVDPSRFSMVPQNSVQRSSFDLSHTHKTTFDAGRLIPIFVGEVLPGDSQRLRMTAFARLATPIVPIMDNLIMESFFFFVPNRLLWSNWERFMGAQNSPSDNTAFLVPQVAVDYSALLEPEIADYMGVSMAGYADGAISVSALPFRAYNLIWNEWFRDQDLEQPAPEFKDDGPDPTITPVSSYGIKTRGKRFDYFTSARPWPQKPAKGNLFEGFLGASAGGSITFPQSGAPVSGLGFQSGTTGDGPLVDVFTTGGRVQDWTQHVAGGVKIRMKVDSLARPDVRVLINDIRIANTVQLLMERNARGGTRYTEILRSHFGVISPDARLQRPEYLGGGRTQVHVNAVAQTSATGVEGGSTVLGELAGIGTAIATNHGFSQSFTEHGVIIGLVSVRADLSYQHGVNRMWFRRSQYDFFWPALANLGEQAVFSRELYCDGTAGDLTVFGYQERWAEYKYLPNRVSGRFRSYMPGTLDYWHLAQNFTARPVLNDTFIQEHPPVDRIVAVGGVDNEQFLFDSVFDIRMARPMPMFSIPGLGPRL